VSLGILDPTPIPNIFDLKLVNEVLVTEGKAQVSS
jgi:hypothetical protein